MQGILISEPYILRTISPSAFHRAVMILLFTERKRQIKIKAYISEHKLRHDFRLLITEERKKIEQKKQLIANRR